MRPFSDDRREALRGRVRAVTDRLPRRGKHAEGDGVAAEAKAIAAVLGAEGLLATLVPGRWGGATASIEPVSLAVVREELAYASGLADALYAVQGLAAHPLAVAGSPTVQATWLPDLARGEAIGAFAVTEPEAGSDVAALTTRARRHADGGWVLDGHKVFISNVGVADVYVVFARVDDGGISAFLVPADAAGVDPSPMELLASHLVGGVRLRHVHVPADHLVGEVGQGLALCLGTLELFRPTVGAAACGLARRALDEALKRTRVRSQFGRPIAEHQAVAFALAELATELDAARLLVYRAVWGHETGAEASARGKEAAMAKLYATEAAQRIVDGALQLHGAAGLVRGGVMEALYREVRALRIYEGTSEIQKVVIARALR